MPDLFREIIEETAIQARSSEFVDQSSGVSVRLTITFLENLVSNLERRALVTGERRVWPRIVDLRTALSAVTGKVELVHEGEEQGAEAVARHVLGKAVREVFLRKFPPVHAKSKRKRGFDAEEGAAAPGTSNPASVYEPIVHWFSAGHTLELSDDTAFAEHVAALRSVDGLEDCTRRHAKPDNDGELAGAMELVLDGLHQCSMLAKEDADAGVGYRDMIGAMFRQMEEIE